MRELFENICLGVLTLTSIGQSICLIILIHRHRQFSHRKFMKIWSVVLLAIGCSCLLALFDGANRTVIFVITASIAVFSVLINKIVDAI